MLDEVTLVCSRLVLEEKKKGAMSFFSTEKWGEDFFQKK